MCVLSICINCPKFFRTHCIRKFLSKLRDKIQKVCKDCPANYIGESKRTFNTRAKEHRAIRNCDIDKNEMAEHRWKNYHTRGGSRVLQKNGEDF